MAAPYTTTATQTNTFYNYPRREDLKSSPPEEGGYRIYGTVTTGSGDNKPVSGATVTLYTTLVSPPGGKNGSIPPVYSDVYKTAITDSEGMFSIPVDAGVYYPMVTKENHTTGWVASLEVEVIDQDVELAGLNALTLTPIVPVLPYVSGSVFVAESSPPTGVENAIVTLYTTLVSPPGEGEDPTPPVFSDVYKTGIVSPSGIFSIPDVEPGTYYVKAEKEGWTSAWLPELSITVVGNVLFTLYMSEEA